MDKIDKLEISIHTLCEEGDDNVYKILSVNNLISIHTLCEEGDSITISSTAIHIIFQSTPSVKRVTT